MAAGVADHRAPSFDLSHDRGPDTPALLETTIGVNLALTAARYGHRDALVDVRAGRRWSYAKLLATAMSSMPTSSVCPTNVWAKNSWRWSS
ncbi:hypothetical protein LAUMK191_03748 [Mycobacterium attenuatum]|uniref:Uncharacterized protein n=1 Tax=Mycobacterium attenuatum TaxID=2341086 RepID=A0A498Q7H8_9MYCO|nr:hypothetical protein LAUMK136_03775 [Mycobacterium attenuatum]VBA56799.1 hypothetical protein LAUMK191_03748 [Mycobacterium attenuatum]